VFADWRDFTMKRKELLFHQQQEEDRRSLTISFTHWRKMTKEMRLLKKWLVAIACNYRLTD